MSIKWPWNKIRRVFLWYTLLTLFLGQFMLIIARWEAEEL
jgi:hypothetical protein